MSPQETRPTTKWSAIRSKAVPSNVLPTASDSLLQKVSAGEMEESANKSDLDKADKRKVILRTGVQKRSRTFEGSVPRN